MLLIKTKKIQKYLNETNVFKPCLKTTSDTSACANIFLEISLTIRFRNYLGMNPTSCYWSYIDFHILITHDYILTLTILTQLSQLFLKISQISQESTCVGVCFFLKVASFQACNVTKVRLLHRCFPVKLEKFWRTPILKNIWMTAYVYWITSSYIYFYNPLQYTFPFL